MNNKVILKSNQLPERFNTWLDFYRKSIRPSMAKYPDSKTYQWKEIFTNSEGTATDLIYEGTIDFVKARCYEEVINTLFKAVYGKSDTGYPYEYAAELDAIIKKIVGPEHDFLSYNEIHGVVPRPDSIKP